MKTKGKHKFVRLSKLKKKDEDDDEDKFSHKLIYTSI